MDTSLQELLEAINGLLGSPGNLVAGETGEDALENSIRTFLRDACLHPPPDPEPASVGVRDRAIVPHHRRRPEVGHDSRLDAGEALRRDSHDLKRLLPNRDPTTENIRAAGKSTRPEVVAQDRDRVLTWIDVVRRRQHPAEGRLHTEDGERIAGDPLAIDLFDRPAVVEDGVAPRLVTHGKQPDLLAACGAHLAKERVIEAEAIAGVRGAAQGDVDQRLRIIDRQGPKDKGVDQGEGRGTRADGK